MSSTILMISSIRIRHDLSAANRKWQVYKSMGQNVDCSVVGNIVGNTHSADGLAEVGKTVQVRALRSVKGSVGTTVVDNDDSFGPSATLVKPRTKRTFFIGADYTRSMVWRFPTGC